MHTDPLENRGRGWANGSRPAPDVDSPAGWAPCPCPPAASFFPKSAPESTPPDRRVFADTPKEARNGFTTRRIDLGQGKTRDLPPDRIDKAFFVPKLCNQCEKPPCVQVFPVGATYQTADGVVLVDPKWCIGCGYCIMACPYGMRFFHPVHHVAEKCNFCYHRIARGMKTACVQACPTGARNLGNLKDPRDPTARIILTRRVGVHKPEYGTDPQVYFLGLSEEVR